MLKTVREGFFLASESEQDEESLYIVQILVPKTNPPNGVSDVAEKFWFLILLALHRDDSVSNLYTNEMRQKSWWYLSYQIVDFMPLY